MICKICERHFNSLNALSKHISMSHKIHVQSYYDLYLKQPNEGICKTCGKHTAFRGLLGYKLHCNNSCAQKDPEIIKKIHTVEHERNVSIGVKQSYNIDTQQRKVELTKQNLLRKYGVTNVAQLDSTKAKFKYTIQQQKEQFCKDNNCTPKQTLIKQYGQGWLKLPISYLYNKRVAFVKNEDIHLIKHYVNHRSIKENLLYDFITSIYDSEIIRNAQYALPNYQRCELDIYLPDLNLAIEYNSNYYHCLEHGCDSYYHYNKSKACWLHGIRLIHIYEFEDFDTELKLLKDLLYYGYDNYDKLDNNKYFRFDNHTPKIIYHKNNQTVYSA